MAIQYPQKRVKTATETGMVQEDTCTWPFGLVGCASDEGGHVSDNFGGALGISLRLIQPTDVAAMNVRVRRPGTAIGDDGAGNPIDFHIRKMRTPQPGCTWNGSMRDGETVIDTFGGTNAQYPIEIRFDEAVLGVGCYLQLVSTAAFTGRLKAFDASDVQIGVSVIKIGTSCEAYSVGSICEGVFETQPWFAIAGEASDTPQIRRITLEVVSSHLSLDDATFDARIISGGQQRHGIGSLVFGPFDPLAPVGPVTIPISLADTLSFGEALRGGINEFSREDIIRFGWRLADDMVINRVITKYDYNSTTGVFQTIKIFTFDASVAKYGLRDAIVIESKGIRTSLGGAAIMANRAQEIGNRFSEAPVVLELGVLYRRHNTEVADVVEVTHDLIPNPLTGVRGLVQERFEVWRVKPNFLEQAFQEGAALTLLDVDSVVSVPVPSETTPATYSLAAAETVELTENLGTVKTP